MGETGPPAKTDGRRRKPAARRRRAMKLVVQAVGAVVGLGLLTWAIFAAFAPENREAWVRLRDASAGQIAAMVGLSAASVVVNGVMFWLTAKPIRALPRGELIAVNALATFLSILPFKVSLIVRSTIHVRRHGMPLRELVAWMAAFAGLTGGALAVLTLAGLWRRSLDGVWVVCVALGLAGFCGLAVLTGRIAKGLPWLERLSLGADAIARDGRVVAGHVALRVVDSLVFGLRFYVAAQIAGVELETGPALLLGTTYLLLNAVAPAGTLGFTEAGTTGMGALIGLDPNEVVLLALINTAAQTLTAGALAAPAWVWLRPDRLLWQPRAAIR